MKKSAVRTILLGALTVAITTGIWLAYVDRAVIFFAVPFALWFGHYLGRTTDLTWKDVAYATLRAAGSTLGLVPVGALLAWILVYNGAPHGDVQEPTFTYLLITVGTAWFAIPGYFILHWLASLFCGKRS